MPVGSTECYEGESGDVLTPENFAGEKILFNTGIKRHATYPDVWMQADEGDEPQAIVECDRRSIFINGTVRDGWADGEPINPKYTGEAYLQVSEAVVVGDYLKQDDNGFFQKYTWPTVTGETPPQTPAKTGKKSKEEPLGVDSPTSDEVASIRDIPKECKAKVIKAAAQYGFAKVVLMNLVG